MTNFLYRLLWEGRKKVSTLLSLGALLLLGTVYLIGSNMDTLCGASVSCRTTWLQGVAKPLYGGYLLKSIITAPLFVLFSTRMAFKVWAVMSLIVIPFWLYIILIYAPIYGDYVNKHSMSNAGGIVYFTLTLAIAVGVPLIEYIVRRVRGV